MSRPDLATLLTDLRAEGNSLEELLRELPTPDWDRPTPAEGWEVRHQVAHLAWTDQAVLSAIEDPGAFAGLRERFAGYRRRRPHRSGRRRMAAGRDPGVLVRFPDPGA